MRKIHPGVWLVLAAGFGFASFILFNNIGSYGADKNHTNTMFTVLAIGVGAVALFCGIKSASGWNPNSK